MSHGVTERNCWAGMTLCVCILLAGLAMVIEWWT